MPKTITVIIPAFNEEKNIRRVLEVLKKAFDMRAISEIVVVDDGSEDKTSRDALDYKVKVLRLPENKGKARAMAEGLKETTGEICVFIDADLVNLRIEHLMKLIEPVLQRENCMAIAKLTNGRLATDIAQTLNTNCSGQRAAETHIFRKIFKTIKKINNVKYGIENIITDRLDEFKVKPVIVDWDGVSQVLKEEKWGLILGIISRIRMYASMSLGHFRNFFYRLLKLFDTEEASD